jgi:hypothetical protein
VVPFGPDHGDLPKFLNDILSGRPFRGSETGPPSPPTTPRPPTVPTIPIDTPAARSEDRDTLAQIADRLSAVRAIATDTADPTTGLSGEAIAPAVRDTYIRFHNIFEDEADFVTRAASSAELTQTEADDALGVGGRLVALLDNPPNF